MTLAAQLQVKLSSDSGKRHGAPNANFFGAVQALGYATESGGFLWSRLLNDS